MSDYDVYYSSDIGQEERDADDLNNDMIVILLLAAVVIVAVLLFTSTTCGNPGLSDHIYRGSYLNKGTNYWFGTISFCYELHRSGLQLGLAVDYAIILAHRFMEEHEDKDAREAVIVAFE